jgi:hypothetical protein
VKDEKGDLLADSRNILSRWKNYFSQLLNVHRVSYVRKIEIHTAEPLVPDLRPYEFEISICRVGKVYKSQDSAHIPAELIQAGSEASQSEVHEYINYIFNKAKLPDQWKEFIIVPI